MTTREKIEASVATCLALAALIAVGQLFQAANEALGYPFGQTGPAPAYCHDWQVPQGYPYIPGTPEECK